jgi:hypothetical protein
MVKDSMHLNPDTALDEAFRIMQIQGANHVSLCIGINFPAAADTVKFGALQSYDWSAFSL